MRTIEQIARERDEARRAYEGLGLCNTAYLTPEERIALDVEYAKAERRLRQLNDEYRSWITQQGSETSLTHPPAYH